LPCVEQEKAMIRGAGNLSRTVVLAGIAGLAWGHPAPIVAQTAPMERIEVVSQVWKDYTEADGTGYAWDILRAVYQGADITLAVDTAPYARSVTLVMNGEADAWVASLAGGQPDAVYPQWHFDAVRVEAVYRSGTLSHWQGIDSLRGHRVSYLRGYGAENYLPLQEMEIREVTDRMSAYWMVATGRVDFYIDEAIEIDHVMRELPQGLGASDFERGFLRNVRLYMAFAPNERGRRFAALWDQRFEDLLADGTVARLFNRYGYTYWPYDVPRDGGS
jgi:polar amino acid transport system substrate-binding protein